LDAAYDELNEYLNTGKAANEQVKTDYSEAPGRTRNTVVPEALRPDFTELGVSFGASAEECKEAYKKLLKIHHPDRHANHEGNFQKATAKSARLNAAYERITQWRAGAR
jgi:DnaJ-class molecular chaperone